MGYSNDPLIFIIPNLMLFTPYLETTNIMWRYFVKHDSLPTYKKRHIPELFPMEDGRINYEELRTATDNFRIPAVVRGLFSNTTAVKRWIQPGYLSGKLGNYSIPVVQNAQFNTRQTERKIQLFGNAIDEILRNEDSMKYLFFPVKSRGNYEGSEAGAFDNLIKDTDELIRSDLDLESKLWHGFGNDKVHKTYYGGQMIAGRGHKDKSGNNNGRGKNTTGTHWHCAIGNNWFVQVAGMKRWYFVEQKYSAWMKPARVGVVSLGAQHDMVVKEKHLPVTYVDVKAGDMIYNPDWHWHRIENYGGISIGCPIREVNISLSCKNNFQYTALVGWNKLFLTIFGVELGAN